ncbi:DUF401 family protein [Chloroflexota bacterium]
MLSPDIAFLTSIILVLVLIRLKLHVGLAVFAGGVVLSLIAMPLGSLPGRIWDTLMGYQTLRLMAIIASSMALSSLMDKKGLLDRLATSMEHLNPKVALHFIPAVIGFVPMPGGALVSATTARKLVGRRSLNPEESTFINYWFRHIWEFSIPVYPSIVITSVILAVPISRVIGTLFPMTIVVILVGAFFSYRILRQSPSRNGRFSRAILADFLKSAWPVILLVTLVVSGLEALIAFPLTLAAVILQQKANWDEIKTAAKYGLDYKFLFFIFAIMLYKTTIESSGATSAVFHDIEQWSLPAIFILVLFPFIIGFATGISAAFASVALPLLIPYIGMGAGINQPTLLLAYVSGMMGVLLTPTHLCLTLSAAYFKANLGHTIIRYVLRRSWPDI